MTLQASTPLPSTITAETMVIRSQRPWWRIALDVVLTCIAWVGFIYLLVRGLQAALLRKDADGFEMPLIQQLLPTLNDISAYIVVILVQGLILLSWARYNSYRFRGKQRRIAIQPLSDENLIADYGIAAESLQALRQQTISVIEHTYNGSIAKISADPHIFTVPQIHAPAPPSLTTLGK